MKDLDLSKIKKVFFIGIGGIGISALAKMAISRGIEVAGVNDEESPKTLDSLRKIGSEIFLYDGFKDLPEADLYVYSDAWMYRGPDVLAKARETGKPVLSYAEALGVFAKEYKVIAISGTHGKTTTTAMTAEILTEAGLDPTVVVGSFVKKFESNFREGKSEYLVVEADEYNRHFLSLAPFITVITNIEPDHLDYYKDLEDIQNAFKKLISQTESIVVYNGEDPNTKILVNEYEGKVVDYTKYLYEATAPGGAPQYAVVPKLSVPGSHNKMNAAAAYAVANLLNIQEEIIQKSLAEFSGTWRRLEKKGETKEGAVIYDDYSHHPTEIKAAIQALRELYPKGEKKITVLFQPHLYSRTKALFDDFAKSFKGADKILLLPIYFAREDKDESVSSEKLVEAISLAGDNAQALPDFESAEDAVKSLNLGPKDVFVTMGAGEAYKVSEKVFGLV